MRHEQTTANKNINRTLPRAGNAGYVKRYTLLRKWSSNEFD